MYSLFEFHYGAEIFSWGAIISLRGPTIVVQNIKFIIMENSFLVVKLDVA